MWREGRLISYRITDERGRSVGRLPAKVDLGKVKPDLPTPAQNERVVMLATRDFPASTS